MLMFVMFRHRRFSLNEPAPALEALVVFLLVNGADALDLGQRA
jgi:hypothetical protein